MAAYQFTERTLTGRGDPATTRGLIVTAPFFPLLGMRPLLGRLFGQADDRPGAPAVIVLNHRFWSSELGGDPHIVGATLTLNGTPFEVVGVAAPLWEPWSVDYYLPLGRGGKHRIDRRQHGSIRAIGLPEARRHPGRRARRSRCDHAPSGRGRSRTGERSPQFRQRSSPRRRLGTCAARCSF